MLNLPRLQLLVDLRRLGTMAAVAEARILSTSAVSQQLGQLQREVRATLYQQVGRRVVLTDAGERLARRAEEMLALAETARAELAGPGDPAERVLRIASFQTPLIVLAPRMVDVLEQRHPDLRIEISQREVDEAYESLLAHHVDVILGEDYPGGAQVVRRGTDREALLTDDLLLVLPAHAPWSHPRSLADLAQVPWALDPETTRTGAWERTLLREHGVEPWVRFDTPDPLLQVHLVRSGHAAAFVPGLIAAEHLAGTRVLRLPGDPARQLFTAARAGSAQHPALLAFRAALLEAAGDVAGLPPMERLEP
ncbi:LysR family transcriptional regulator [Brachybacterium squillarum]|uniref:LysR family transcriptional regulator n=1 Tax=Brachybacterium squillarum TaxID=661979 RepID=UPI0002629CDF|nr:LysR family transcriptional regulator [Brachybacterium squillarum]